ncbi:hypothetical protein, partial [Microvirga splendida]|uniref:hypothetical protein n=1 Tax=Microvirga splendida TaxID=2795727 RepID=UPI001AEF263E
MNRLVFFIAFLAVSVFAASYSHAATQQECLKALELGKRFEQDSRKAHAAYKQENSEIARCEFLNKSRRHLDVQSRHLMDRIKFEAFGLLEPGFADE